MPMHTDDHGQAAPVDGARSGLSSRLVLFGFLAVAAFYLFTEHRAHLLGWLPYLIFLACPLMHLFHRNHGGSAHADHRSTP